MNAITYKEIFPLIKDNKLWLGLNNLKCFTQKNGDIKKFGNINWYTNLEHLKRNEELILTKKYYEDESKYPKYDNYEAIEVSRVANIPNDYYGVMGVPITFLNKLNPKQFKILGSMSWSKSKEIEDIYCGLKESTHSDFKTTINGRETYYRIFIKRIK